METRLEAVKRSAKEKTLYNFYSAKTIYLAKTPFKYFLLEKKEASSKTISLMSRNTVVYNSKNGMLLFPEK